MANLLLKSVAVLSFALWKHECLTDNHFVVHVAMDKVVQKTDSKFISITLDTSLIQDPRWQTFNFSSPRLKTLLQGLSPAILRMGGSPADWTVFSPEPNSRWTELGYSNPLISIHMDDFDKLVKLTRETDLQFLYDLNLQLRYGKNWDPSDALAILHYLSSKGYGENIHFELGNEPSEYWNEPWFAVLNGSQIGRDFLSLKKLMETFPEFNKSLLVGPDIAGVHEPMLNEFLAVAGKRIDAVTFHHYYFKGTSSPDISNFLNVSLFGNLEFDIQLAKKIIRESPVPNVPIWLGETSDCWNGGSVGASDRYVSGFMWLEKLGLAARMGVQLLLRQDFYGRNYGLIDDGLRPNPDYWLSWLHKMLVGDKVLDVSFNELSSQLLEKLRIYAHCTMHGKTYKPGAITGFAVNVNNMTVTLTFTSPLSAQDFDVYWMTPGDEVGLLSKKVALNGKVLEMVDEHTFPVVTADHHSAKSGLTIPPLSFGFFVFPNANAKVCI